MTTGLTVTQTSISHFHLTNSRENIMYFNPKWPLHVSLELNKKKISKKNHIEIRLQFDSGIIMTTSMHTFACVKDQEKENQTLHGTT